MARALRVLLVEDSADDAELVARELRRTGFAADIERVDTPEEMLRALSTARWDIILSDFSMPRFSGPAAFAIVRSKGLDIPFILISGTVGETVAVEVMRLGV